MTKRVAPVNEYCDGFRAWQQAIIDKLKDPATTDDERILWEPIRDAMFRLGLPITKSNLLYRLIYLGETLRTEKCPEHKGRWSGYAWKRECACQDLQSGEGYLSDLTGWLP